MNSALLLIAVALSALESPVEKTNAALLAYEKSDGACAAVVLNCRTGEIVYMYNHKLCIMHKFPIGSLAKPMAAAVLLNESEDVFKGEADSQIVCDGRYYGAFTEGDLAKFNIRRDKKGGKYFRCSIDRGHGLIDMERAVSDSCNVWFLSAASKSPAKLYKKMIQAFYLTRSTGARLNRWYEPERKIPYYYMSDFEYAACSIGEGRYMELTPLKIAQVYAGLFEGGAAPIPFEPPLYPQPQKVYLGVSPAVIGKVYSMMERAVKTGTLSGLKLPAGIKLLAGKTGSATRTSEIYRTHGWNVLCVQQGSDKFSVVSFTYFGSGRKQAANVSGILLTNLFE